ncbi:MAG: serine/threonine-protein kinase [Thermoanaerobaculia bacterium]
MLEAGQSLGSYRLIAQIGAGGMGEVWKAEDTRLGRIVAIKILPPKIANDSEAMGRMRREARTAAQLNHPNIATIHSFEQDGERLFIVMEFVEGEPLTALIARGPLQEAEVSRIGRGVADALAEAHAKGIVHRDIKPDNIIVSGTRVKVLDFGIAKRIGFEPMTSDTPTAFVTQEGMIVGTIHYMSPEQALGKSIDARTDIFSLGVVLYEAATGRQPFKGETVTETITQIIRDEPPAPRRVNPAISPGLASIIQRCMRKNRDERFASASDLAAALAAPATATYTKPARPPAGRMPADQPAGRRRSWPWIVAAVVLLGAGVYSYRYHGAAPAPPPAVSAPSTTTVKVAAPPPTEPEPDHFALGMSALLERKAPVARKQFELALENPDLTPRQQRFARLGIAIASGQRLQAQKIAREIHDANPGDPDLERIRRTFAMQPGGGRRPWKPRVH